jgi:hypothetical protein
VISGLLVVTLATATASQCEDVKRDMKALEIFLQDQDDHEKYCPKFKWDQPDISVYKEELKSQLPEKCKPESNK